MKSLKFQRFHFKTIFTHNLAARDYAFFIGREPSAGLPASIFDAVWAKRYYFMHDYLFFPTTAGSKAAKARRAYGRKAQSSRSRGKTQRVAAGAWQGAQQAALLSRLLSLRCQQWEYFSPSCFSQFRVFPVQHPRCGLLQDLLQDQPFVHLRASRLKRAH